MNARGRPLSEQRLRMRVGEEFRGSFCSFFCVAWNSSSVVVGLIRMAFSSARLAAYLSEGVTRFLLRSMAEGFGMAEKCLELGGLGRSGGFRATEGHAEQAQKIAAFVVSLGRGHDGDIEAHVLLH